MNVRVVAFVSVAVNLVLAGALFWQSDAAAPDSDNLGNEGASSERAPLPALPAQLEHQDGNYPYWLSDRQVELARVDAALLPSCSSHPDPSTINCVEQNDFGRRYQFLTAEKAIVLIRLERQRDAGLAAQNFANRAERGSAVGRVRSDFERALKKLLTDAELREYLLRYGSSATLLKNLELDLTESAFREVVSGDYNFPRITSTELLRLNEQIPAAKVHRLLSRVNGEYQVFSRIASAGTATSDQLPEAFASALRVREASGASDIGGTGLRELENLGYDPAVVAAMRQIVGRPSGLKRPATPG